MRPETLVMEGFGRYAEPTTVDFTGFSCAALVGENGSGKSTVLDGILFALYGSSRWTDLDRLVSWGRDRAEVALTFLVEAERYRVTRTRLRGKSTKLVLSHETSEGTFEALSDTTLAETQAAIDAVVGATGEIATSTVFVLQNDAARFTSARPADRKALLGQLIGIDRYGVWAERARRRASGARGEIKTLDGRIGALGERVGDHDATVVALEALEARLPEAEARAGATEAARVEAERTAAGAAEAAARVDQINKMLAEARARVQTQRDRATKTLAEATARNARAQAALANLPGGGTSGSETVDAGALDAGALDAGALDSGALDALRQAAGARRGEVSKAADAVRELRSALERAEGAAQRATAAKVEAESHLEALLVDDATCYTCGQHLGDEALERMSGGHIAALDKAVAELAHAEAARDAARVEVPVAVARHDELAKVAKATEAELAAATEAFATAEANRVRAEAVRQEGGAAADALTGAAQAHAEALADDGGVPLLETQADEATRSAASSGPLLATAREATEAAQTAARALSGLREDLARMKVVSEAEEKAAAGIAEATALRDAHAGTARRFDLVAEAFGAKGIPALIYEGVVAELEADASAVLAKLSGGRMGLRLETVKEKKKGGEADTLEIVVVEAASTAFYHERSGGEKFRIDLALRIALSRLLTRRSGGTPLRTMAIDEGFGSLDSEGRLAMIECLEKLTEEFDLVLAMTHTPEVADAFPVEIRVSRDTEPAVQVVAKAT